MKKTTALYFLALLFSGKFVIAQTQPNNPGFENWTGNPSYPVGWASNQSSIGYSSDLITKDTVIFHSGLSAMKLKTDSIPVSIFGRTIWPADVWCGTGTLITSPQPTYHIYGIPCINRPDSVVFWYMGSPILGDTGIFQLKLTQWTGTQQMIAQEDSANHYLFNTNGNWIRKSVSLNYLSVNNPDTVLLKFNTSASDLNYHLGTTFWVDDIKLIYSGVGIFESASINSEVSLFPNPSSSLLYFSNDENLTGYHAEVFDISGKLIISTTLENNSLSISLLEKGNYILKLTDKLGRTHDGRFEVMR